MIRFSLRTLVIIMLLLGPLSAWSWQKYQARLAELENQRVTKSISRPAVSISISPRSARFGLHDDLLPDSVHFSELPTDPYHAVTLERLVDEVTQPTEPNMPQTVVD